MTRDSTPSRLRNDELRRHLLGGGTVASPKIAALDLPTLRRLISQLAEYDDFSETARKDHAFGAFDFQGVTIVFKIEAVSLVAPGRLRLPASTEAERVMTIMFEEYAVQKRDLDGEKLPMHAAIGPPNSKLAPNVEPRTSSIQPNST